MAKKQIEEEPVEETTGKTNLDVLLELQANINLQAPNGNIIAKILSLLIEKEEK